MMLRFLAAVFLVAAIPLRAEPIDPAQHNEPVRVACVGDSITFGAGIRNGRTYPAQLQEMLGGNWDVRNFGVSGRTLMRSGDAPYWRERAFQEAKAFRPDAVVILLGANDTKPHNWQHKDEFAKDYRDLVNEFRGLPSKPHVYLCRLIPVVGDGNFGITEKIALEASGIVDRLAGEMKLDVIDLHQPLAGKDGMIPDRVHPNPEGAKLMAETVAVALSGSATPGQALLRINSLFRDHAVLPRDVELPVWGTSAPGDEVKVTFADHSVTTTTGDDGTWQVMLEPMAASSEPRVLTVSGNRTVESRDLLVGDVWLASGQSNMERQLGPRPPQKEIIGWREAAAAADLPQFRQYYVPRNESGEPVSDADGSWTVSTPESATHFTAVGFFFGRDLHAAIKVPVGIIHSSWGGTVAEAWTSAGALKSMPDFRSALEVLEGKVDRAQLAANWLEANDPGSAGSGWQAETLDTAENWKPVAVPSMVDDFGLGAHDGVFWFRREIELPAELAGKEGMIHLGKIDDEDTTWINGQRIGSDKRWQNERNYTVPVGVLKAGRNVIAVRMINNTGAGGWTSGAAELHLDVGGTAIPLSGEWQARLGVDFAKKPMLSLAGRSIDLPARLYNAMIAPLPPFPIKGVIWYQGESNNNRPAQYRRLLPTLIRDWRAQWKQPELPFLVVQIAPHNQMTPELREAQLQTVLNTPGTALVVTTDVGDARDIHPADKGPVGARLALAARAVAYGEDIEFSGPFFQKMTADGPKRVLHFSHAEGLQAKDGPLKGFEIAGADGQFVSAEATIHDGTVIVGSPEVSDPVAVRYGWSNVPDGNLFNAAGLPASPFRTNAP